MCKSDRELLELAAKNQADAVLLSRGKKPPVRLSIKGKSESQIFDMLTEIQSEGRKSSDVAMESIREATQ